MLSFIPALLCLFAFLTLASSTPTPEIQINGVNYVARSISEAQSLHEQFMQSRSLLSAPAPAPASVARRLKQATRGQIVKRAQWRKANPGRRTDLDPSLIVIPIDPCAGISNPTAGPFRYGVLIDAVNGNLSPQPYTVSRLSGRSFKHAAGTDKPLLILFIRRLLRHVISPCAFVVGELCTRTKQRFDRLRSSLRCRSKYVSLPRTFRSTVELARGAD